MPLPVKHPARVVAVTAAGLLSALIPRPAVAEVPAGEPGTHFGLGAGFLVPTWVGVDGEAVTAEPGPLVLIAVDTPVGPDSPWHYGGFLGVGSFSAGRADDQVNLLEIGGLCQWEQPDTWGGALRLGGRLGYRQLFADAHGFDSVRGIALDLTAQWRKPIAPALLGQIEAGLLTEPFGSNGAVNLSFGPFPYLALGVLF